MTRAFEEKPFHHGENYPDAETFIRTGSGAVVRFEDRIVASASSFMTLEKDVELDISTKTEHRRKHLARACAAKILLDCQETGITAHWDAQNIPSKAPAEQPGYTFDHTYTAYCFVRPECSFHNTKRRKSF